MDYVKKSHAIMSSRQKYHFAVVNLISLTTPGFGFRAPNGDHQVCPVWRPAGLPEEEPRTQRYLLQGPGC